MFFFFSLVKRLIYSVFALVKAVVTTWPISLFTEQTRQLNEAGSPCLFSPLLAAHAVSQKKRITRRRQTAIGDIL
jgi:hypothetical protein